MAQGGSGRDLPLLTSAEAAARLGVRTETLYAYVSRGRVRRVRTPDGSRFDPLEIERVAASRRRQLPPSSSDGALAGTPLMVLETDVAAVLDGDLVVRGVPLGSLVERRFEDVAAWLWGADGALRGVADGDGGVVREEADGVAAARAVGAALPPGAAGIQRLQAAVPAIAATDPTRGDLDPGAVARRAGVLLGCLPAVLDAAGGGRDLVDPRDPSRDPFAARLWPRLSSAPAADGAVRALSTALVALVDHDLAASTLAARAAASARADVDGVVLAGLGALDSALHGRASAPAHRLLARTVATGDAARAIAAAVRDVGRVPGFGHRLYAGTDPRAAVVLAALRDWEAQPGAPDGVAATVTAYDDVADAVGRRTGLAPNVDLALGALTVAAGAAPDAGEVVFALARTVGWVAHALDEYTRPPLRLRPTGRYVGPR